MCSGTPSFNPPYALHTPHPPLRDQPPIPSHVPLHPPQHAAIQVDLSLTHRLPKVVAHLSDDHDAEALQQLEEFLVTFWGADMLNAQFMMTFVSLLLLAFLTFSQSTLVAMVLVPVTYALCFCSPYLEPSEVQPPTPNPRPNSADFADLVCRLVGFLGFCRFVLLICWVSGILLICSADLLGFWDFAGLFC